MKAVRKAQRGWAHKTGPERGAVLTADCTDTDPPALGRTFGQSDGFLMQIVRVHHAMRVMTTEICCQKFDPRKMATWHTNLDSFWCEKSRLS